MNADTLTADIEDELGAARIALAGAIEGLRGAGKDKRDEIERGLLDSTVSLAWLYNADPAEYERAMMRLGAAGNFTAAAERIRKAVRLELEMVVMPSLPEPEPGPSKREATFAKMSDVPAAAALRKLAGACVPAGLMVPIGYELSPHGVRGVDVTELGGVKVTTVCPRPILVTGLLVDPDGIAPQLVVLRWHDGRAWCSRVVRRGQACQARELSALSEYGVPVGSSTCAAMAGWLEAFIVHNAARMPTARAVTSMGWRDLDTATPAFVIGPEVIRPAGVVPSQLDDSDPTTWPENAIHLRAEDAPTLALTRAWRVGGTWDGWLEVAKEASAHPALGLALRAAVAPMVLRIVGAANFVLDIAGITSQGKSTALYFAASAMGFPDDKQQGIVRPWNATRVSIERVSAFCADLPVLLDDTRQLSRKQIEDVSSVVYMVVNGQGRGRGTATGGTAASGNWHTVMLSTGETPITELAAAGGASARTVSLFGSPLGGTDQEAAARAIRDGSFAHHGHVARRVAAWLMATEAGVRRTDIVKVWYAEEAARLAPSANDSSTGRAVLARASDYVACLAVVGRILEAVGVPKWRSDPQAMAVEAMRETATNADRPTEALGVVYAWCCERPEAFYGRHNRDKNDDPESPLGGRWLGAWSNAAAWANVAINAETLRVLLRERRFDVEATLRTWAAREWIEVQRETRDGKEIERPTRVVKVNGVSVRCVVIKADALVGAGVVD